jgi:hypothetical protein
MPKVTFVKKARKAIPDAGIKAGDAYYWWKFRYGGIHRSLTPPKPSQLTQSAFISTMLDLQDRTSTLASGLRDGTTTCGDAESELSDIASEVRSAGEECQSSLDNMPEGLQQGSTGQLLEARVEAADTIADELEGIQVPDEEEEDPNDKEEDGESVDDKNQDMRNELADEVDGVDWSYE